MSLDGLRAWIGEVERKLGMRTRVFLVLVAIAIGGAAAGIYLALDAASESVSKDEVAALQEQASTGSEGGTSAEAAQVASLKAEIEALRNQVSALESEGGSAGGASRKGTSSVPEGSTPKGVPSSASERPDKSGASTAERLGELLGGEGADSVPAAKSDDESE
jgi:cell division protein FtsB